MFQTQYVILFLLVNGMRWCCCWYWLNCLSHVRIHPYPFLLIEKCRTAIKVLFRYQPSPSSITSIEIQFIFIYISVHCCYLMVSIYIHCIKNLLQGCTNLFLCQGHCFLSQDLWMYKITLGLYL
jgi:hypothetical protein